MAFNPFSNFWKYKRAWMAGILLLTMVTFVLCTGQAGDLGDTLQKWFAQGGKNVFSVDGKRYTDHDLSEIVQQRKLANEFMKQSYLVAANSIRAELEQPAKGADKDKELEDLKNNREQYSRLTFFGKKPFFGTINSLDAAAEHVLWLAEADRLRVDLDERAVEELWRIYTLQVGENAKPLPKYYVIGAVQQNMGRGQASEKQINKALKDEFRIWIAKRSLLREFMQDRPTMDLMVRYEQGMDQVFSFFEKKRSSVDIALIPIQLQELAKKMSTPPKEDIQKAFNDFHKNPFQPDSENWSLASPQQARFAILTADANSDRFRGAAQAVMALEAHPITALSPLAPMASALRLAAGAPATDTALLEQLSNNRRLTQALEGYSTVGSGTFQYRWPILNYYANRSEPAIASRVAASALNPIGAVAGFWAHAPKDVLTKKDRQKLLDEAVEEEVSRRVPVIASLVARAANGREAVTTPLVLDGLNMKALDQNGREHSAVLPISVIRPELQDLLVKEQSARLAQSMMVLLRNYLQVNYVKAGVYDADKLEEVLERFFKQYGREGFKLEETSKFHSKLDVQDAPELKPLKQTFSETLPFFNSENQIIPGAPFYGIKKLEPDQFYMLFFENNDFYAATQKHRVSFWPPKLSRDKANAENQLLLRDMPDTDLFSGIDTEFMKQKWNQAIFWRVQTEEPSSASAKLDFDRKDETYKKAVLAANMVKARDDDGLKLAREIAEQIIMAQKDYASAVRTLPEGKQGTSENIPLRGVAPWVPSISPRGESFDYRKFVVPAKTVPYARPDMSGHLLALNEAQEPFTIKQEALDALNKTLFEMAEKTYGLRNGKVIQVLTNKPRDVYYVAVVERFTPADPDEFRNALASSGERAQRNLFMFRYRVEFGKEFTPRFIGQLKRDHNFKELDAARGQEMFKNEAGESDTFDDF